MRCVLLRLVGNDEKHLNCGQNSIEFCWPELPLIEHIQYHWRLHELRWEEDLQFLEAAILVDEAMQDECVGIEVAGINVGPCDFERPGCFEMTTAGCRGLLDPGKRVLQYPILWEPDMQIDG